MRTLSPRTLSELREHLIAFGPETAPNGAKLTRWLAEINRALAPKRSAAPARKARAAKKAVRGAALQDVRSQVMDRADGACECCGGQPVLPLELDHFFGGSKRRSMEAFESCWALCRFCHHQKTNNNPSAAYWLRDFVHHCRKHGFLEIEVAASARLEALRLQGRA